MREPSKELARFAQGYHAFASHLAKPILRQKKTDCFAVYCVYETSLQTAHQLHYEERKTGNQMNLSNGTLNPAIEAKNTHTYLIYIRGGYEQFFSTGFFFVVVSTSIGISQYIPFSPLRNT